MEQERHQTRNNRIIGLVILLIVAALLLGWWLGRSGSNNITTTMSPTTASSNTAPANNSASSGEVKSLVSYTLPDGWKEGTCPAAAGVIYIVPNGTKLDCQANPSAPIKLYVDAQSTNDCQQLNNAQGVKKHVCISSFIDGHKSLKAATQYAQSSSYNTDTTFSDYYIDTGKGVVKVEYTYTSSNTYQAAFDQFATSINVK